MRTLGDPPAPRVLLEAAIGTVAGAASTVAGFLVLAPAAAASLHPRWRAAGLGLVLGVLVGVRGAVPVAPSVDPSALQVPIVQVVEGTALDSDPPGPRGTRATIAIESLGTGEDRRPAAGKVVVRFGPSPGRPGPGRGIVPSDRVSFAARLDRFPAPRNPGAMDIGLRHARRGVSLRAQVPALDEVEVIEAGDGWPAAVARARGAAARSLDALLPAEDAGLARAMVLGDRLSLGDEDRERFRASGQVHVVAVSGLHVTLLLAFLLQLLARAGVPRRTAAVVGIAAVVSYVPFAGAAPSAERAGAAGVLYLLARIAGRDASPLLVLSAVGLGLLVFDPPALLDAGFTLSFAAVLGILLVGVPLESAFVPKSLLPGVIPERRAPLRRGFAISLGAWLATAPMLLAQMGQACPIGALAAIPVIPLGGALLAGGFAALAFASVPLLGEALGWVFSAIADATRLVLEGVAATGAGNRAVEPPDAGWYAAYLLAFLVAASRSRRRLAWGILSMLALLACALVPGTPAPAPFPRLVLLDVGHGQAAVLLLPDGRSALIDAGSQGRPDVGARVIAPALRALGVRRLSCAILSHPDADHTVGIGAVAREFAPREILTGPAFPPEALARLARLAPEVEVVRAGRLILEGAWGTLEAIAPESADGLSDNDASLVLLLTAAGGRTLLPGDIEGEGARRLLARSPHLDVETLVLPHHGLAGPGRDLLLAACGARTLLASCDHAGAQALPPGTRATAREGALAVDLRPNGPRVEAPWTRVGPSGRYDPTPLAHAAVHAPLPTTAAVVVVLLAFAVLSSGRLRWLTRDGAAAAFLLGVASWLAFGAAGLAALFAPFLVATLLGKMRGGTIHGPRTVRQVAANGIPAALGALAALLGRPDLGAACFTGSLACLGADTCATEIGVRFGGTPRRFPWGRRVDRGESGGVTGAGLAASVGGAFLAPAAWTLAGGGTVEALGAWAAAGLAGSLVDSLLGATVQYRGRDGATGRVTEARVLDSRPTEPISGLRWLDNDGVNLASGLAAAVIALALSGVIAPA